MNPQTTTGWKEKSPNRREALRALLADGRWHSHLEMMGAGGSRFGARLLELRRGVDGPPLEIVGEADPADDSKWRYKAKLPNERGCSAVRVTGGDRGPDAEGPERATRELDSDMHVRGLAEGQAGHRPPSGVNSPHSKDPVRGTLYVGQAKPVGRCPCGSVAHFCATCHQCNAPGHQKCEHAKAREAGHA